MEPVGQTIGQALQHVSEDRAQVQPRASDVTASQGEHLVSSPRLPGPSASLQRHPDVFSKNRDNDKSSGQPGIAREIPCPFFVYERQHNLPHSCSGLSAQNMSDVRRHLIRPHRGGGSHLTFLKRCPICNEDIVDERAYHQQHGSNCNRVRKLRRGAEANALQWMKLYETLYPGEDIIPSPYACEFWILYALPDIY